MLIKFYLLEIKGGIKFAAVIALNTVGQSHFAFVGTGANPEYPVNEVIAINQITNSEIIRYNFDTQDGEVINLMNSPLNVFVACFKTSFFICQNGETSKPIKTRLNPKGLISIRN